MRFQLFFARFFLALFRPRILGYYRRPSGTCIFARFAPLHLLCPGYPSLRDYFPAESEVDRTAATCS